MECQSLPCAQALRSRGDQLGDPCWVVTSCRPASSSVTWALFASRQTGVLSPALPTLPSWVLTLWESRWPFISCLLSLNSMNVTKWRCSLCVCVCARASSHVHVYRFHWSTKLTYVTNHKMLFWYFRVNTLFYLFLTYLDFSAAKAVFKSVYFKKMNVQSYSFLSFFLSVLPVWPLAHFSLVWKKEHFWHEIGWLCWQCGCIMIPLCVI